MHKCKVCFKNCPRFAPELRASGCAWPEDLKCPICDTVHEGKEGRIYEEYIKEKEEEKEKIR